ncbi:hypothetical protein [Mycolicibacterium sphagni]|uniref:hypothetical protein n=1 Tax=Mycolicibacterium sphagni TaxID=1786 RepID=UPI0021F341B2|nr:hypothetical protein [Mycolicibacterium sphagni]MCV7174877.1 hypothetical protein [Mycolicibacterium sphagni]
MLTTVDVKGVTVTAEQIGHFVVHPAILHNIETGEFFLSADTWSIQHVPSGSLLMQIHEADPLECPGNPLAINLDIVRDFLAWIEPFTDWSQADLQPPTFPTDEDRMAWGLFAASPVFWERPTPKEDQPK